MAVYKDKKLGTWYVSYRNTKKRGFKTKFEAQQYEAKMKLDLLDEGSSKRFHDICEDYKNYKESRITHGSFMKLKNAIDIHIVPNTPNKQIRNITQMDVRKFDEYVRSTDYATSYKRSIINYYKAVFRHSELFFNNTNNPTVILETIPLTDKERIQYVKDENNIWTIDEFNQFIEEVEDQDYKVLYTTLYLTGIRIGEALALNWNDFDNKSLSISKNLTRKSKKGSYAIKATKTKTSVRTIETGDYLGNILKEHKKLQQRKNGFKEEWFIFGGDHPLPQTTIDYKKDEACKKADVRRIRIHDFRHSHASNLISDGVSIPAVSRRLGHSDINITLKTYTHLIKSDNDKLMESINNSTNKLSKV